MKVRKKSEYGKRHTDKFADGKTHYSNRDIRCSPARQIFYGKQIYTSYTRKLFNQLSNRRQSGFLYAVEPTIDAGMDADKGKGKGDDPQKRYVSRFFQKKTAYGNCSPISDGSA